MTESATISADDPRDVAIPVLLEQHGGQIHALARRLCGHAEDADDLVQQVFLQAWRKWDSFEGRANPSTWLYTIASRVCQRMHRKRSGEPARMASLDELLPFDEELMAVVDPHAATPEALEVRRESRRLLEEAIATLPGPFRLPLVLKEIVGLPLAEIAAVLGVKESTVKTRVHRARLRLRQALFEGLPTREGGPPLYPRRVCLDLLDAKQEALDRGVDFPVADEVVCERCRAVFDTLDLARQACRDLAGGALAGPLRERIGRHLCEKRV